MRTRLLTGLAALALLPGCVLRTTGLIEREDGTVLLQTPEGRELRLVLTPESQPLRHLEGHLVEVKGRRSGRRLVVTDWSVPSGLHGLQAWVGPLREHGMQLALQDRNTGALYLLDPESWEVLREHVGDPVLVEGYVEGAHRVRVMYFRVLADERSASGAPEESP